MNNFFPIKLKQYLTNNNNNTFLFKEWIKSFPIIFIRFRKKYKEKSDDNEKNLQIFIIWIVVPHMMEIDGVSITIKLEMDHDRMHIKKSYKKEYHIIKEENFKKNI